uniref:Uncharacterized protein n=1 Tax=Paramormyrops kingsleyae TaxID=1676925 RepID=A0A3B3SGT1_9TELE
MWLAEMTLPSADRDRLILVASRSRSPMAPVLDSLSLPARSTRLSFPALMKGIFFYPRFSKAMLPKRITAPSRGSARSRSSSPTSTQCVIRHATTRHFKTIKKITILK